MHPEAVDPQASNEVERTRELFAQEVSVALETSAPEAMARVDAVAQRLGVSSL